MFVGYMETLLYCPMKNNLYYDPTWQKIESLLQYLEEVLPSEFREDT
jgi:hypothetical protein